MKEYEHHNSSLGRINANILAALCYVAVFINNGFGFVAVIFVFFSEKDSGLVKFHAMQALILTLINSLVSIIFRLVFGIFPVMSIWGLLRVFSWVGSVAFSLVNAAISLVFLGLTVLGAASAYRWKAGVMPIIGQIAQAICNSSSKPSYTADGPVPTHCKPTGWANSSSNSASQTGYTTTSNTYTPPQNNASSQQEQQWSNSAASNYYPPQTGTPKSPHGFAPGASSGGTGSAQSSAKAHKSHDPNTQLPADMRDGPVSKDMN